MFPKIHVSLLTENDVICIWSIVNLSQLWHLLMAKRIETDQKHIKNCIFSLKYLVNPIKSSTFATPEPAKPLNDAQPTTNREQCQTCLNIAEVRRRKRLLEAQMSGSFFYMHMTERIPFGKHYTEEQSLSLFSNQGDCR